MALPVAPNQRYLSLSQGLVNVDQPLSPPQLQQWLVEKVAREVRQTLREENGNNE
ncbi:MAG: hypothetical protein IRZ31_10590 [Thermogemmatispora sp.]|uniref:hypothetical protein n=1 Tax=Thermogemmatispora sp. TaxID=1968838 RepID=UPI002607B102|nr:hypothetical protein [Thermogemmatispora sp.]MBX5457336.1 hypothetical protein [Thermogemmatispora sp.]